MLKADMIQKLNKEYGETYKTKEIVLGEGNINANVLLIGEAPGKDEVKLSKPFVGAAGKKLTEFLSILELDRDQIYITNAIKYRLSKENVKTGRMVNRPAQQSEIQENRTFLLREIKIINPSYIVTLGNVPLKSVTSNCDICIGTVHGMEAKVEFLDMEYRLFPLYHPASIIYNRSLKEVYLKDIENFKGLISCGRGVNLKDLGKQVSSHVSQTLPPRALSRTGILR
jgi:uracil-DNA glycosylase